MRILSLVVPSSTCTGWAVLETGEVYVASGRILPGHVQTPKGYGAYQQIKAICAGVRDLLDRSVPDRVIMELTSEIWSGVAVGAVWREVANHHGQVAGVLANEWTRRQSKRARRVAAELMFPQYSPESDRGGYEADALMLNVYFRCNGLNLR